MSEMSGSDNGDNDGQVIYESIKATIKDAKDLREHGNVQEALELLKQVGGVENFLTITDHFPDEGKELWATLLNHIGLCYQQLGDFDSAEKAHKSASEHSTSGERIAASRHIASIRWLMKHYSLSSYHARNALNDAKETGRTDLVWFDILITKSMMFQNRRDALKLALKEEIKHLRSARKTHKGTLELKAWKRAHWANIFAYLIVTNRFLSPLLRGLLKMLPHSVLDALMPLQREYVLRMQELRFLGN